MSFYGPQDHRCPKCEDVTFHGIEMRCPVCGWSPSAKPVPSTSLGDVTVAMSDPGVYESEAPMDFKDGGYPIENPGPGGVK